MTPNLIIGRLDDVTAAFVRQFDDDVREAQARRGRAACALSGGSVARIFLPALRTTSIDWRRVHWFWADERAVPPGDPESNYQLAHDLLLKSLDIGAAQIHRMAAEAPDLDGAARAYETDLVEQLGHPPELDVLLLGVGPDGHVASLFPGSPAAQERSRLIVAVSDAPKPPPRRLTITFPVIAAARHVYIAAFGAEKRDLVRRALNPSIDDRHLPVVEAMRVASDVTWFLDEASGNS